MGADSQPSRSHTRQASRRVWSGRKSARILRFCHLTSDCRGGSYRSAELLHHSGFTPLDALPGRIHPATPMRLLFELLRLFLTPRASLVAENLALRQQLVALRREP